MSMAGRSMKKFVEGREGKMAQGECDFEKKILWN